VQVAVAAGADSGCAIYSGAVRCWGSNTYGQLGNEGAGGQSLTPVTITGSLPKPVPAVTPQPKPAVTPKPAATISTLAGKRKVSK
jgi:Regulator of chromosome condensation (RCC1) repeat